MGNFVIFVIIKLFWMNLVVWKAVVSLFLFLKLNRPGEDPYLISANVINHLVFILFYRFLPPLWPVWVSDGSSSLIQKCINALY